MSLATNDKGRREIDQGPRTLTTSENSVKAKFAGGPFYDLG